jgi:hypothetical protein
MAAGKDAFAAKERGNKHFQKGQHADAIVAYTTALTALPLADAASAEESGLRAACLANRAAARLQLATAGGASAADAAAELARAAREDCSASLALLERTDGAAGRLAPLARKALFRRALAHERLGCADERMIDLSRLVVDSAGAGEHPLAEAMSALHGLLTSERLPADGALAAGVEALLAVLSRGLADGGADGDGASSTPAKAPAPVVLQAPQAGAAAALEAGANLVRPEHKWQAYTALLAVLTARAGARGAPMRAFISCGGARVAHTHLHSMEGDWMADAKRGTIRAIDALVRLPTVAAAMRALELSQHGLHAPPADGLHGAACTH